jgi:hypothetical protein
VSKFSDIEQRLDADPLAVRLTKLAGPPVTHSSRAVIGDLGTPRTVVGQRAGHRRLVALVAAVSGIALLITVTPAGASIARAVLPEGLQQRLGLVEGAPAVISPPGQGGHVGAGHPAASLSPVPCPALPQRFPTVSSPVECSPSLSLADAQRQVEFHIPLPLALPAGLAYRGALVDSPHSVLVSYRRGDGGIGGMGLAVRDDGAIGGSAVPSGSIQTVTVNGGVAYFVRGAYENAGPGTAAHWNPNADDAELTWQAAGLTFDLTAGSLHLSAADLIRIAESVG